MAARLQVRLIALLTSVANCGASLQCESGGSGFCRRLAKVRGPQDMIKKNGSMAARLYDDYHKLRQHNMRNGGVADRASQRVVTCFSVLFPPDRFPTIIEGGPGNCWLLRTLQAQGYDVHGQEISRFAIEEHCQGLDVRQGFLQETTFASGMADFVLALDVMEHIPALDLPHVFREIRRITKTYFLFNVAACAKHCKRQWFCSDSTIHQTGLCDDFPRQWWEGQLYEAGFTEAPQYIYDAFQWHVLDYAPVVQTPNNSHPAPSHKVVACYGHHLTKCITPWNRRGHNFFIFYISTAGLSTD
eukprot:TRINITY_DN102962_c0_g1_i1.p1 TRINITY_DN102962_c0_g1~~TRINITY_DN102962_c0_g1_i1.p1  ORF type:complete len:301 (-),score=19.59 TRINITY_DN102962_c0_g1_i1:167-1069(-)